MVKAVRVRLGRWEALEKAASDIRMKVFVKEQGVPADIEMDAMDASSLHAIAVDLAGRPVGTGRLLPDGHIGRMAVLPKHRGKGIGGAILSSLLEVSFQRGDEEAVLSAQVQAVPFYTRFGFEAEGDEYEEAGIPHVVMRRLHPES